MDFSMINKGLESFELYEFSGGVDTSDIEVACNLLNLPFPPEYKEFLQKLGSGYVESEGFIGLGGEQYLNILNICQILSVPSKHSSFPKYFIPISSDGYGNYDCINTNAATDNGEFEIVYWLHDGGETQNCEILARSYWEWFNSIMIEIREEG